jgi:IclR family acetate operon transcriptional repressor
MEQEPRRRTGRASEAGSAVGKALRVLEAVAAEPGYSALGEVAAAAGVPKPTAVRILATLCAEDYVIRHPRRGYTAGPRLRTLRHAAGASADTIDAALAELSERTRQTSNFALRVGGEAIYTHQHDGSQPYRITASLGTRFELHGTAIGKAILASLPDGEVDAILGAAPLRALTPRTITDPAVLRAQLEAARTDGYAVDDEENELTIRCLAVPVFGADRNVVGAVSLSAVTYSVPMEALTALAPQVVSAARHIGDVVAGRE